MRDTAAGAPSASIRVVLPSPLRALLQLPDGEITVDIDGAVTIAAFVPAIFFGQKDLKSFDASATLLFLLTTAPALLAYAFAFLGLTSLASQLVGTPGRARALTLGLFALLWLAGLPEPSTQTIVGMLAYLSPWQLKMGFLAPEAGGRNLTLALALGYGALFTGLGYLTFRRRDL